MCEVAGKHRGNAFQKNSEQLEDDWGAWDNRELLAVSGSWKSLESLRDFILYFLNRKLIHCRLTFFFLVEKVHLLSASVQQIFFNSSISWRVLTRVS